MAEILISIAAKFVEYLVEPTIQQGQYLFCVRKIIKNLEDEKKKLMLTKENVQNRVEEAKKKTEKIENAIDNWMNEVTNLLAEVENLLQEINENNSYCQGCNGNWRRYHLCRQMVKKTKIMIELNNNSKFKKFSRLATLPSIEYFSSRNFIYFESTQLAYNQLFDAIQAVDSYMIGLYGMGGCGKTTLVKEVGKKAKELNLFDRVAFTTVSQTPNFRKIQGEIADLLGLKLDEETEAGRARRISLKLQSGERVLVILDDVWARLNLEDIGIPFHERHGACKVLLTTRRQQVCTLMECQKKIPLYLLSEEEAWVLLQKHAKLDNGSSSSSLNELALGVVRECKGLPLAIEVVGTSLSGKSIDDWRIAHDRLKNSKPIDIEDGVRDVFACLELSFKYLGNTLAKSLLLICSLFPEDHEILTEDLFRCVVGTGLCGEVDSFVIARSQVNASINKLIDSCLLMHPQVKIDHVKSHEVVSDWDVTITTLNQEEDGLAVTWHEERTDRVKMHDMVRDVSLWIASQGYHTMMVNTVRDLKAKATDCFAVSLWDEEIPQIPDQLDAPKLEFLLLLTKSERSLKLSNEVLEVMKGLKVITIISSESYVQPFLSLPQSTQLTNLQILRLLKLRLGDIAFVVSLRRLEILDLSGSYFEELPNGIEMLSGLKLLDLSWCKIEKDCYQVIARCSQLEELYAVGSNIYCRSIDSYECFVDGAAFPILRRYLLEIGGCPYNLQMALSYSSYTRFLQINNFNAYTFGAIIKDLLQRSEKVSLFNLKRVFHNLIPELVRAIGGFNELTYLYLHCSSLRYLIDTTIFSIREDDIPPKLVTILLSDMYHMTELCCGPPPVGFFEKLKELQLLRCWGLRSLFRMECNLCNLSTLMISYCTTLTFLFPMSVAQTMVLLQHLNIEHCPFMEKIIGNDTNMSGDPDTYRFLFPKLRILSVDSCDRLTYIFPISCVKGLLQLESLKLAKSSYLKYVFDSPEFYFHSPHQDDIYIKLPFLKELRLKCLPNLLSIFPDIYESSWPSLTKLICEDCPSLRFPPQL